MAFSNIFPQPIAPTMHSVVNSVPTGAGMPYCHVQMQCLWYNVLLGLGCVLDSSANAHLICQARTSCDSVGKAEALPPSILQVALHPFVYMQAQTLCQKRTIGAKNAPMATPMHPEDRVSLMSYDLSHVSWAGRNCDRSSLWPSLQGSRADSCEQSDLWRHPYTALRCAPTGSRFDRS